MCVLDRNISLGEEGGIVYNSVRSAVYGLDERPRVLGYHIGLAGKEVRVKDIKQVAERALTDKERPAGEAVRWI